MERASARVRSAGTGREVIRRSGSPVSQPCRDHQEHAEESARSLALTVLAEALPHREANQAASLSAPASPSRASREAFAPNSEISASSAVR